MFKLDRLTIRTFRDVVPGTTLEFGPRFNVLLGVNATGKSTLLDLIAAICADDLSTYRQEALDIEYVVSSVAAEDVPLSISCSTRWNADEPRSPRADLTLTMKDEPTRIAVSGRAAVCNETQFVLSAAPDEVLFRLSLITSAMSAQQAIGNRAWLLFNAAPIFRPSPVGVRRFDESLRYFDSVRTRWRRKTPAPAPPSIAKRIAEELPEDGSTPYKLVQVNGVDWFDELLLLLGFKSAQLSIAAPEPGALEIRDFVFLTLNGRACGPESLSYGQKRLLAFEWYRHSGGSYFRWLLTS
jgi:energy-coupling factor transporter ATP-binding protein EcfA2